MPLAAGGQPWPVMPPINARKTGVLLGHDGYPVTPGRLLDFDTRFVPFASIPERFRSRAQKQRNSDVVLAMRAPANDDEINVDGTANWVCYQEAKTEVKTEAKTEEKSKKKKVKTELEKTEEKRKAKIPRISRQAKNATAKLDFGKKSNE